MELTLILSGLVVLIVVWYKFKRNGKKQNKDIYPHF